ncbi:MAG: hypothetical protein JWO30_4235 [Fibrobacteres bacterium]|nr:hypothetical protein [Fibrobacterota bacterium]
MELPFLDVSEIIRDKSRWRQIARGEAVHACREYAVVVVHRAQSRDSASWLDPANRFFKSDGPYLYDGLRYFLFTGSDFGKKKLSASGLPAKPEQPELEPLEAMDISGEAMNLGSPALKKPPVPGLAKPAAPAIPKSPGLPDVPKPDIPSLPDIPELPTLPDLALPELPQIPDIPEIPQVPQIPSIPEPGIPEIPAVPGVALPDAVLKTQADLALARQVADVIPPLTVLPSLAEESKPAEKRPIEIKLADARGQAIPGAAFRIKFPDGSVAEGKSDDSGLIRFPDNTQEGEVEFTLTESPGTGAA